MQPVLLSNGLFPITAFRRVPHQRCLDTPVDYFTPQFGSIPNSSAVALMDTMSAPYKFDCFREWWGLFDVSSSKPVNTDLISCQILYEDLQNAVRRHEVHSAQTFLKLIEENASRFGNHICGDDNKFGNRLKEASTCTYSNHVIARLGSILAESDYSTFSQLLGRHALFQAIRDGDLAKAEHILTVNLENGTLEDMLRFLINTEKSFPAPESDRRSIYQTILANLPETRVTESCRLMRPQHRVAMHNAAASGDLH